MLTFKGGWGDGTEGAVGNLKEGKGPVAEKVCITGPYFQKCLPPHWFGGGGVQRQENR